MLRPPLALFAMLALPACIIVTDPDDDDGGAGDTGDPGGADEGSSGLPACGDPETFSFEDADGSCVCEEGLVWCSEDVDDFSCCLPACGDPDTFSEPVGDECRCVSGFDWCTDDPEDITCCEF